MKTKSFDKFLKKKLKKKSLKKHFESARSLLEVALTISKARDAAGLSQSQLASRLGTTQSVISRIESGNQNLSLDMLSKIAAVLECHLMVGLKPIHKRAA
jgi:UDP-N-acetylglucosamine 1-carboxyvinyltransferase